MPLFEARAVAAAIEDLQTFGEAAPEQLAAMLLVDDLALLEQVCHSQNADRAATYALALCGLDGVLPDSPAGSGIDWKRGDVASLKAGAGAGRHRIGARSLK